MAAFVPFLRKRPSAASLTELMPGVGDAVPSVGRHSPRSQREHVSCSLKIKYRSLVLVYLLPFLTFTPLLSSYGVIHN